jgi:N-acetylneuraminate synthase/N,N'-diacetyllegionaminate synthase
MSETATRSVNIEGRQVGPGHPVFIIAEAGVNHNGDPEMARQLVHVAVAAGADAVKFQTFRADSVASAEAPKAEYQVETTGNAETQLEMLRRLELSPEAHREIQAHCRRNQIMFLSTPFDEAAADLLEELDVPAFKISSGDLTNLPLLEHIARKGKPLILSTGMSNLDEVADAVKAVRGAGCDQLVLLHCVTNYPAGAADINLRAMRTMTEAFGVPVGYSDHTNGIEISLAAVALGACVIEKHFTLDRDLPGPDHRASLEPAELAAMVQGIRKIELALGDGRKVPTDAELKTAKVARRSLFAAENIPAGAKLTRQMISVKRPGTGLAPALTDSLVGRTARANIVADTMLSRDMFEDD